MSNIRVRFAPSPTGYLHLGSLRTALFNFLFARHENGRFILRIEDTDQSRKVEGASEKLMKILRILGIEYDEGPDVGGDYGPYYQSQRLELYRNYCKKLIDEGKAYYAFETPEELEEMRKIQQMQGKQTMYDRRARNLSPEEVKKKLDQGLPHVIRLKVPLNEEIRFKDLIRGNIKIDTNQIDDQVLIKSDGYPTYHLANVIDDHLMKITHIIRGEEWITSVPKHIILYNAFNWEVPQMAHLPLILNTDKTKLSKRQGDVAVEDYLSKGYLPEALINFMALLGWNPGEGNDREIFSLGELISLFTLERVGSSGAVFNIEKLNWMNSEYIKSYDIERLADLIAPYFIKAGFDVSDRIKLIRVVSVIKNYISKLEDAPEQARLFYSDPKITSDEHEILQTESTKKVFIELESLLKNTAEITETNFKQLLSEVCDKTGVRGRFLFQPVRLALTGEEHGPELGIIAYALGKEEILKRVEKLINHK